jgi:hypothetical protein
MPAVRVMKMVADPVIDVVAVRHRLMTAAGAMDMAGLVPAAAVVGRTPLRIFAGHRDYMLVDMIFVRMVQVAVVQIVGMAVVTNRGVTAARAVAVVVFRMRRRGAGFHRWHPLLVTSSFGIGDAGVGSSLGRRANRRTGAPDPALWSANTATPALLRQRQGLFESCLRFIGTAAKISAWLANPAFPPPWSP